MIVSAFFQQLAVLLFCIRAVTWTFIFVSSKKKEEYNIDLLVTHFARKRNLFVKKCKGLKLPAVLWLP